MSLQRFHDAQEGKWAGYATALGELRGGRKTSHWIWYIFPQLGGLGRSATARAFGLRDVEEASDYLRDPVLRGRYEEIAATVAEQMAGGVPVERLMGGSTDALKLASSLTLFRAAASRLAQGEGGREFVRLSERLDEMLRRMEEQGYGPCGFTLGHCAGAGCGG